MLKNFVDDGFAAFVHGDDLVNGRIAGERDVDDIVAGIEHEINGRAFIQHVLVDGHLGSLGLGLDADRTHALRFLATKQFFHFAHGLDVIDVAQRAQSGREADGLGEDELRAGGLVDESGFAHEHDVLTFIHGDLRGSELAGISAIDIDVGAGGRAGNGKRRHKLHEMGHDK